MKEAEKLKKGLWYDASYDPELLSHRLNAEELCYSFNNTKPSDYDKKDEILQQLLPNKGINCVVLSPLQTDYGYNCFIGDNTFINHNAYLMDCAPITIGAHCFIGPNCGFYTAIHPLTFAERNLGIEKAEPITIKDNVWIGGHVTVLPGVTIGSGSVIGAGSVVTKNIPANTLAVGNPCRILKKIEN